MCESGNTQPVMVIRGVRLGNSALLQVAAVPVDSCIAALVHALNAGGQRTLGSCCGHGVTSGSIILADGRELVVVEPKENQPLP